MNKEEKTIIENAIQILDNELKITELLVEGPAHVKQYLRLKLESQEREVFAVLFLDNSHKLIKYVELFQGTINEASVYPREVIKEALLSNSAAMILVHNHPSGNANASPADIKITKHISECANLFDIRLLDHMIVCKGEVLSFAEKGLL